ADREGLFFPGHVGLPVFGGGNDAPGIRLNRDLDAIVQREAVSELLLAVAAPDDSIDRNRFAEFQFDPYITPFVGNPTPAFAEFAVIEVFEPVQLRVRINARRQRGGSV